MTLVMFRHHEPTDRTMENDDFDTKLVSSRAGMMMRKAWRERLGKRPTKVSMVFPELAELELGIVKRN